MTVGVLEALTSAIGQALNEVGGLRFTRLTASCAQGLTTLPVETTYGWPYAGKFVAKGVLYSYTSKTATTLGGVTHLEGEVVTNGLKEGLPVAFPVVDFSKTFSALDRTIQALFVDYATGENLSIIGRNLGVDRPVGLEDDDTYREVIRSLAYLPRGTMYGLELALTAFFGAGNFEVWENFPTHPNTVFIRINDGYYLASSSVGQAYLNARENQPLTIATKEIVLSLSPDKVQGVRLAPELSDLSFAAQKPSTPTEVRYVGDAGVAVWTFAGTNETTDVLLAATDGGVTRFTDTVNGNTAQYFHTARIRPESYAYFDLHLRAVALPSLTDGRQFMMRIADGGRDLAAALFNVDGTTAKVGFVDTSTGALIGTGFNFLKASYKTIALRKNGTGVVELLVDGSVVETAERSLFAVTAANEFRFGCNDAVASGTDVYLKSASFSARTTTDFWNLHGTGGAATAIATFDTNSGAIAAGDVGKLLRTYDAPTKKNQGGWLVATRVDSDVVTLTAPQQYLAILESANPTRVRVANNERAFKYPDDIGKRIDLSAAVNAPNPGIYTIDAILDPVSLAAYAGASEDYSNVVTVSGGPGFVTETEIPWKLLPNFAVEGTIDWELSEAGALVDDTLTLRENPPLTIPGGYVVIVEVVYSVVKSAQLLPGIEISNDGDDYFPFYLPSHALGPFQAFIDNLTVAGVIPEISL